jgi:hypothetical protein
MQMKYSSAEICLETEKINFDILRTASRRKDHAVFWELRLFIPKNFIDISETLVNVYQPIRYYLT